MHERKKINNTKQLELTGSLFLSACMAKQERFQILLQLYSQNFTPKLMNK